MAKIEGLNKLTASLEKFKDNAVDDIMTTLIEGGKDIEAKATRYAPIYDGLLKKEIFSAQESDLSVTVQSPTFYAPYIEFGTKRKFKANGRQEIAAQYKGKAGRGTYEQFLQQIFEWVKKKGISETYNVKTRRKNPMRKEKFMQVARAIADSIMRNGIEPQPYFFRAFDEILPEIRSKLRKYKK